MKPGSRSGKLAGKASRPRTTTRSKAKHAGPILSTIDQLRKRKTRPDLSRICHLVQRQHKLPFEQTRAELDILVGEKLVIKVDSKDSVSYHNVAKWQKQLHDKGTGSERAAIIASTCSKRNKTGRRVLKAVKNLLHQVGNKQDQLSSRPGISAGDIVTLEERGVTVNQIENWITEKWGTDVTDSMEAIKAAAANEVNRGHLIELTDGSYTLRKEEVSMAATEQSQKRGPGRPRNEDKVRGLAGKSVAASESSTVVNNSSSATDSCAVQVSSTKNSSQKKFGGKRKPKLRKSVDQEVDSAKKSRSDEADASLSTEMAVVPSTAADGDSVKCTYCQSSTNRRGNAEDLLVCKDCRASIHPSCMDLSEELAHRAARSPWQCIDCKTCNVCDDSGDADEMLFCDACDKGYHMNCHKPPVLEKPTDTDKWVCCRCVAELKADNAEPTEDQPVAVTNSDSKVDDHGETSCLPTPNDSPVHCKEEIVPKDMSPPASDAVVTLPKLSTTLVGEMPDASDWSVADVAKYFTDVGFVEQAETFRAEEIDGKALLLMTRNDVLTGMSFKLGPALKIYAHVQKLQTRGICLCR